mgnify:CR=1 FL=1|jgi:DNA-binding MarR family transcriptional regulator
MYYDLTIELLSLVKVYEKEAEKQKPDVYSFGEWLSEYLNKTKNANQLEPEWEGKAKGRSADSLINTSLVHLYRYAKLQAKTAIANTLFSTPDDFIYLINLTSFGSMTKTALIKLNVHEKSAGIQIVNRLIANGLVEQNEIDSDKRNRIISITPKGKRVLEESIDDIRQASKNVTEPLSELEKMDLIRLLTKLEDFHEMKAKS